MEITSPAFKENATAALADVQLQKALGNVRGGFIDKRRKAVEALPEFDRLRDNARDIKDHTLANLDLYLEAYEAKVIESRRPGALGRDGGGGAQHRARHLPHGRRPHRDQGQVDDHRGDRAQRVPRAPRHPAGRDRPRRIHHPAAPRASEPHHRAGRASQQGAGRGRFPPRPHASARRRATCPSRKRCSTRRGACCAGVFRGRCRHHRRQFPGRRDRHLDHRHQRGQWRPDADPAARAYRHRLDREDRADAGGRRADPARAGALGDRPGHDRLHDAVDRAAARRRSRRAGASTTSCCSTMAARRCSAPSSRTCCAASAAAPA